MTNRETLVDRLKNIVAQGTYDIGALEFAFESVKMLLEERETYEQGHLQKHVNSLAESFDANIGGVDYSLENISSFLQGNEQLAVDFEIEPEHKHDISRAIEDICVAHKGAYAQENGEKEKSYAVLENIFARCKELAKEEVSITPLTGSIVGQTPTVIHILKKEEAYLAIYQDGEVTIDETDIDGPYLSENIGEVIDELHAKGNQGVLITSVTNILSEEELVNMVFEEAFGMQEEYDEEFEEEVLKNYTAFLTTDFDPRANLDRLVEQYTEINAAIEKVEKEKNLQREILFEDLVSRMNKEYENQGVRINFHGNKKPSSQYDNLPPDEIVNIQTKLMEQYNAIIAQTQIPQELQDAQEYCRQEIKNLTKVKLLRESKDGQKPIVVYTVRGGERQETIYMQGSFENMGIIVGSSAKSELESITAQIKSGDCTEIAIENPTTVLSVDELQTEISQKLPNIDLSKLKTIKEQFAEACMLYALQETQPTMQ